MRRNLTSCNNEHKSRLCDKYTDTYRFATSIRSGAVHRMHASVIKCVNILCAQVPRHNMGIPHINEEHNIMLVEIMQTIHFIDC